jgi:hypothetical protein
MSKRSKDESYVVGYGKPPEQTKFKKGASGNPKGRPKGSKNFNTIFERAFNEKVAVTDSKGRKRNITMLELSAKQLANIAGKGNLPAIKIVLATAPVVMQGREIAVMDEAKAMRLLLARLLRMEERRSDLKEPK